MTVIGLRNMFDGIAAYANDTVSPDGDLSLVLMSGLVLIPLVVAAFFYPAQAALLGAVTALVVAAVGFGLSRRGFVLLRRTAPRTKR